MIRVALIDGPLRPDHPALVRRNVLRPGDTGAAEGGHAAAMAAALLAGCPDARIENLVVFAGGLTTNAACVADAMEDARGADLVLCAFGMTRADPALALATARVLEGGAVIVAAAPARGAPVFPAAFDGVVSVQGDARCGPTDWSRLDLPQARFGACPALAPHPGVAGASVAAAHFAGIVARHLAGGAPGVDAIALIARTALHQGRERRGLATAPQPG